MVEINGNSDPPDPFVLSVMSKDERIGGIAVLGLSLATQPIFLK